DRRLRNGHRSKKHRPYLRGLLHNESKWDGNGTGDLPFYHRGSFGSTLGGAKHELRICVLYFLARKQRQSLKMAAKLEARDMVFIVDDDESLREALARLFRSVGLGVQAYATPPEFLASKLPDLPSCLVLDIRLPGMSGLDFQAELGNANINIPIIFITGHGDIPMTVKAMKAGAVEFLTKPLREQDLLDAVRT